MIPTYVRGWWSLPKDWCVASAIGIRTLCGVRIRSHADRQTLDNEGGHSTAKPAKLTTEPPKRICEACVSALKRKGDAECKISRS